MWLDISSYLQYVTKATALSICITHLKCPCAILVCLTKSIHSCIVETLDFISFDIAYCLKLKQTV